MIDNIKQKLLQPSLKRAWVITQEGTNHPIEVIGILSARKSENAIKNYLEWIYGLLNYHAKEHIMAAKYNNPYIPYKANLCTLSMRITCGHNPWVNAVLAKNVILKTENNISYLTWQNPTRFEDESENYKIKNQIEGKTITAKIILPIKQYNLLE